MLSDEHVQTIRDALFERMDRHIALIGGKPSPVMESCKAALAALDALPVAPLICDKCNDYLESPSYCEICYGTLMSVIDALPVAPQADWSQAPEWAQWWACDPAGWTCWYEQEPIMYLTDNYSGWVVRTINGYQQGHDLEAPSVEIPLGIDWRECIEHRPIADAAKGVE